MDGALKYMNGNPNRGGKTPYNFGDEHAQYSNYADFEADVIRFFEENAYYYVFHKDEDWETEREYRFVVRSDSDGPIFVPVTDALVGVVVGWKFPASKHSLLERFAEKLDFKIARIRWKNDIPRPEEFGIAYRRSGIRLVGRYET